MIAIHPPVAAYVATASPCNHDRLYSGYSTSASRARPFVVRTLAATGTTRSDGIDGEFVADVDFVNGRYSVVRSNPLFKTAAVFDGRVVWVQDRSNGVHPLDAPSAVAAAVTQSYLNRQAYLAPNFSSAHVTCKGERLQDGHAYNIVYITPKNGRAFEQWIDAKTHLVSQVIEKTPTSTVITRYSDYREIGPLVLPFVVVQQEQGDVETSTYASYTLNASKRDAAFRRPSPPNDVTMAARSVSIPCEMAFGAPVVYAAINGYKPLPFILDTGGHAIVTREAAALLHLTPRGAGSSGGGGASRVHLQYAHVDDVRIGTAHIKQQTFLVIPYGRDFTDRSPRPPLAGILGLEVFERFGITIDYARHRVILEHFDALPRIGRRSRIAFEEDIPVTAASVDGVAGSFDVDTGNSGTTILFDAFLRAHRFLDRFRRGEKATGSGTGGPVALTTHTLSAFAIGGREFHRVVAGFAAPAAAGSFSSMTSAGNFGYDILARFVPTFDYADGLLYLPAANHGPLSVYNKMGFSASKAADGAFIVARVRNGSSAAAKGIHIADRIEQIDGVKAQSLAATDLWALARRADGTPMSFHIVHANVPRDVRIRLKSPPLPD